MPSIILKNKEYTTPEDYTDAEIIDLSGVLGIHNNINEPGINLIIDIRRRVDHIWVYITSIDIKELYLIIYPCNKYIKNESFIKDSNRTGLAFEWVKMQVDSATLYPFKKLMGQAHRDDTHPEIKWKGYFVWPKFGYLMTNEEEIALIRQLKRDLREEKNLQDLFSTEKGIEYWILRGATWDCYFDLNQNSLSRNILSKYKRSGKKHLI